MVDGDRWSGVTFRCIVLGGVNLGTTCFGAWWFLTFVRYVVST
jgi:hypothetical protein